MEFLRLKVINMQYYTDNYKMLKYSTYVCSKSEATTEKPKIAKNMMIDISSLQALIAGDNFFSINHI